MFSMFCFFFNLSRQTVKHTNKDHHKTFRYEYTCEKNRHTNLSLRPLEGYSTLCFYNNARNGTKIVR